MAPARLTELSVVLDVASIDEAIQFYAGLGFEVVYRPEPNFAAIRRDGGADGRDGALAPYY